MSVVRVPPAPLRFSSVSVLLLITGSLMGSPLRADDDNTFRWLMHEPVTLFDLGILRLRQDLHATADWLLASGEVEGQPLSGVYYDWNRQRVVAYVTVPSTGLAEPTAGGCRAAFAATIHHLLRAGPQGVRQAEIYLENLFLHEGSGNLDRPRTLGPDLVESVRLQVTLLPSMPLAPQAQTIRCDGRFDSQIADVEVSARH